MAAAKTKTKNGGGLSKKLRLISITHGHEYVLSWIRLESGDGCLFGSVLSYLSPCAA